MTTHEKIGIRMKPWFKSGNIFDRVRNGAWKKYSGVFEVSRSANMYKWQHLRNGNRDSFVLACTSSTARSSLPRYSLNASSESLFAYHSTLSELVPCPRIYPRYSHQWILRFAITMLPGLWGLSPFDLASPVPSSSSIKSNNYRCLKTWLPPERQVLKIRRRE